MVLYSWLIYLVNTVLSIYWYLLIATAILSWIPDMATTRVGRLLAGLTEPYLRLFRRIPPVALGGILLDVSYIIAIIVYFFARQALLWVLIQVLGRIMVS